jgi:serine/threonine protein kinase
VASDRGAAVRARTKTLHAQECVIHRDLKPDNMLLTKDWKLKLTDFGEARAADVGATMTSVGTPIYISPEVMRADHYDKSADVYSYGVCLVAMIRAESTIQTFFYECLRKFRRKKNLRGLGMGQMTKFLYDKAWRPLLPTDFVKCYPKLHTLIQVSRELASERSDGEGGWGWGWTNSVWHLLRNPGKTMHRPDPRSTRSLRGSRRR